MYYIASCSCGNDSMAMVYELVKRNYPLNEVIRYNNGMDFSCIDVLWGKIKKLCEPKGIICTELHPEKTFEYTMFEQPHKGKHDGVIRYGYGWCGGFCREGTRQKKEILDKYCESKNALVYVGIAYDEKNRTADKPYKLHPLKDWKLEQTDCLEINRQNGVEWLEPTPITESGYIDLYTILDRVSCWCCANKNAWELYNIWKYLPNYWEKLKEMQSKIEMPMKKFSNKKFGEYGNVFALEKVFESGYIPKHRKKEKQFTLFDFINN